MKPKPIKGQPRRRTVQDVEAERLAKGLPIRGQSRTPGSRSNAIITARNGGVPHQFIDNIGGCSANYQ